MSGHTVPVSIGLPVYNGEKFIKAAVESVLRQSYTDFELIISDNSSTDATSEICEQYAVRDSRIKCYRSATNLGASKNYNRVFELSSGCYFKWLAVDDSIEPTFVEKTVTVLDREPEVVLAFSNYTLRNDVTGTVQLETRSSGLDLRLSAPQERIAKLVRRRALGPNWPIWGLIRTEVLRETHLIRGFVGADDCLLLELALRGQFAQLPEPLHMIRYHPEAYHNRRYHRRIRIESLVGEIWFDPANRDRVVTLPHWRRLKEFFVLIIDSDVTAGDKLATLAVLPRYALQQYKKLIIEPVLALAQLAMYVQGKGPG
jgi:glycosyltransferase involved in cell wall biosynthesis